MNILNVLSSVVRPLGRLGKALLNSTVSNGEQILAQAAAQVIDDLLGLRKRVVFDSVVGMSSSELRDLQKALISTLEVTVEGLDVLAGAAPLKYSDPVDLTYDAAELKELVAMLNRMKGQ